MSLFSPLSTTKRREVFFAAAAFFVPYFVYLLTLYPQVTTEDGGEFTTAVATLGIAHPSGYPLYVVLGKIFTLLVPFGNMAWRVNLFSAFGAAAAVSMLYFFFRLLTKNNVFSLFSALIFASGSFFWSQAVRAEVYSLNSVFFLGVICLVFYWYEQRLQVKSVSTDQGKNTLFLLCFLYGLSLGNHQLMLLSGPPIFLFVFFVQPKLLKDWKFLLKAFLLFLLGLSVYLYLPVRALMKPDLNWGDPSNWQSFWDHVRRKFYGATSVDSSLQFQADQNGVGAPAEDFNVIGWIATILRYDVLQTAFFALQHFIGNFFAPLIVFMIPGCAWLSKKFKKFFWLFLAFIVFYSFVLSYLIGLGFTNKLPVDYFKDKPFYIPVLLLLFCLSAFGLFYCFEKLVTKKMNPLYQKAFLGVLGIVAFSGFIFHFHENDQSKNYLAHDLAVAILEELPPDAVMLVSNGDNTLFPIFYLNLVEGLRKDVTFYIPSPIHMYHFYQNYSSMVAENPGKRYFTDFPFESIGGKTYDYLGPLSEVVESVPKNRSEFLSQLDQLKLRGFDADNLDHYSLYLKGRFLVDKGLAYDGVDEKKQAAFFQQALQAAPESKNIFTQLIGNYYTRNFKFAEAIPYLEQAVVFLPHEYGLNFQLLIALILENQPEKTMPYFKELARNNKDQFLHDYEIIKQQIPEGEKEFEQFEAYLKNNS